ncbi:hypothetical protein ABZP36_011135 [Zizania latifolia]
MAAVAEQQCSRSGDKEKDLLSAVVGDIRFYAGSDPLRPWLRGMRKMEAALRAKLPRFLQKCAQEFLDDARFRDDPRYLRVWIQLMDYVKDAKPLLKKMEKNRIGLKRAAFYMAYALHYEKHKSFEDAEKMYHLGTQNFAEPIAELQKAHEQFVQRMELYKRRKYKVLREGMASKQTSAFEIFVDEDEPSRFQDKNMKQDDPKLSQQSSTFEIFVNEDDPNCNNQKIAQHMNFNKENTKVSQKTSGSEIFVDENELHGINGHNAMCQKSTRCLLKPLCDSSRQQAKFDFQKPFMGGFAILPDDEDQLFEKNGDGVNINSGTVQLTRDKDTSLCSGQTESKIRCDGFHPAISGLREDTVIHRFVGSAVVDEPKVENACHHGLVEPTINLKEAMNDINNMFGRPLNFKGEKPKNKKTIGLSERKAAPLSGFSILADDDPEENPSAKVKQSDSCKFGSQSDLFEPTVITRDVMAEINDMFGMPLDFQGTCLEGTE